MLSTSLLEFETRKSELYRQAAAYRLAKSLNEPYPWIRKAILKAGKLMVESGQQIVKSTRSAQTAQC